MDTRRRKTNEVWHRSRNVAHIARCSYDCSDGYGCTMKLLTLLRGIFWGGILFVVIIYIGAILGDK